MPGHRENKNTHRGKGKTLVEWLSAEAAVGSDCIVDQISVLVHRVAVCMIAVEAPRSSHVTIRCAV